MTRAETKFRRLMFAQDTGSAIVGPARADIYFGAGAEAARMAGRIRNPGQFTMLIPRELDPVEAARAVPLPPERAGVFRATDGRRHDRSDRRGCSAAGAEACCGGPTRPGAETKGAAAAMSRRHPLSDEDHALWTGFVRSIKPLRRVQRLAEPLAGEKLSSQPPPAAPRPVARLETLPEKKPPALAPLGRRLKQRVARGREAIDARLDLHGYTQTEAHAELFRFLQRAQANGARMALVVTGKGMGRGSDQRERGVLKRQVPMWLSCRNSDRWLSDSRTRISAMAEKARCMSGCGERAEDFAINLIIGLPTQAQETVKFVCKDDALDRSSASCPRLPKPNRDQSRTPDDLRGKDLFDKGLLDRGLADKGLADKGLADKQAFAQVEKWMATIRELSYERPEHTKFRG